MAKGYVAGAMLKDLNKNNTNVGLKGILKSKKAGQKLKNMVGARPNPTNEGSRTALNGKRGRRRAAMLD